MDCIDHPCAPHGFDRNASHSAGEYVCECASFKCPVEPRIKFMAEQLEHMADEQDKVVMLTKRLDEAYDFINQIKDSLNHPWKPSDLICHELEVSIDKFQDTAPWPI